MVDQEGRVTFLRDSKFFFTLYHAGKVNIFLHLVSLSFLFYGFLFYGLTVKSVHLCSLGCLFLMRWGTPTITSLCITVTLDSVSE
jgi:membrane-bound ClpP family serine protease